MLLNNSKGDCHHIMMSSQIHNVQLLAITVCDGRNELLLQSMKFQPKCLHAFC